MNCVFCKIASGHEPAEIVWRDVWALVIIPLNPVTPGHVISLPKRHAKDFDDNWLATHDAMRAAFYYARSVGLASYNMITSKGHNATQTVFHLHLHLVPRTENDGLVLPWSSRV